MCLLRRVLLIAFFVAALPFDNTVSAASNAIDAGGSRLTVYVSKRGMFSFLADNHEIEAPIASGSYDASTRIVEVHVKAAALKVLDPQLSEDTRAKVQAAMDSSKVLDVEKYPTIDFRSSSIEANGRDLKIAGDLSLHGQTHPVTVQARQIDAMHYSGSATIRQTAFGITPIKVAGGAVSVQDDVKLKFTITLNS